MDEMKARELIVSLARDCERNYLNSQIYKSILEAVELDPRLLTTWRDDVERLKANPPAEVRERIGALFGRFYDFATKGLDNETAQNLLDRIQRLHDDIQ